MKHLQFTTTIHAPVPTVWRLMLDREGYPRWASAFAEGCYFEGSWEPGAKISFLSPPSGDGMLSEIAQNRQHEFISIRHRGLITNGVEDTASDAVRGWAPAYENYSFASVGEGTTLVVDLDVLSEWEEFMNEAWPKALALLKQLSEAEHAA